MKCDETKPACRHCIRRGITCGGYPKAFKWKQFVDPEVGTKAHDASEGQTPAPKGRAPVASLSNRPGEAASPGIANYLDEAMNSIIGDSGSRSQIRPSVLGSEGSNVGAAGASSTIDDFTDNDLSVSFDESLDQDFGATALQNVLEQNPMQAMTTTTWNANTGFGDFLDDGDSALMLGNLMRHSTTPLYQQPSAEAGQIDLITRLFQSQTCVVLSVKDDFLDNPWQSLIWPLTKNYPELKHALNAMTCLQCCKLKPELHARGLNHLAQGIAGLRRSVANQSIRVDAALATTLALSLARTWEAPRTTTDFEYMNEAKTLLKQALANVDFSTLSAKNTQRLSFLANTWIYMDVIARLTSSTTDDNVDTELISKCRLLEMSTQAQIDPLLGCAADLFPLLGQAADLVRYVWQDESRRNSPAVISQAAELMRSAETWMPEIDMSSAIEPEFIIADAIQTGEAFRWSLILMLRQAVPALPGFRTTEQIAQKILVYLATIPAASASTCVHMFPLLIAGCEVSDQENRTWVSERWKSMTGRLISGVVERCVELTEEAWKRKDSQEDDPFASAAFASSGHDRPFGMLEDTAIDPNTMFADIVELTGDDGEQTSPTSQDEGMVEQILGLGESATTQQPSSSSPATSLRSRLSWLAVMHDWKWQVMLG